MNCSPTPASTVVTLSPSAALYTRYKSLDLPPTWQGNPAPVPLDGGDQLAERVGIVWGIGVSPGIAEGTVRVVRDADSDQADDFEPGDKVAREDPPGPVLIAQVASLPTSSNRRTA
jgi:hypothetical protein